MTAMEESRTLINDIEGHLLLAAARAEGRAAAARVTDPLDWLTDGQREFLEGRFEAEYLVLARDSWQRTAVRAGALREEYEEVYRGLRRRLLAGCLLGWVVTAVGVVMVCLSQATAT
ncbi:hypothetical protein ACFYNL_19925 [Streptomyces sp. NPDC007808]|uniref:hypothetical protein n=1 Tax=Streptomyces sp. NPDC007808 TaxID=3364779 RepID=UPI0036AB4664